MIESVATLIASWPEPSVANFARDIGVTVEHAAGMKRRTSIPLEYWGTVIEAARALNIEGVTVDGLLDLHRREKEKRDAERLAKKSEAA